MTPDEKADISRALIKLTLERYPRVFLACSFGKDSRVLVDLATSVKPDVEICGIDTGYEFKETLEFANELIEKRNLNFKWLRPTPEDVKRIDEYYGDSFIKDDQYKCCEMKIPAINNVIGGYDAWITGLRRDETEFRKNTGLIEQGKIVKVNPIAFWNHDDIWTYIKDHKLEYHPLYDKGYPSLGCEPCTKEGKNQSGGGRQGKFERAGRFTGTGNQGQECGLHTMV
ncbi:phosphoadenylyl-sulfate reductase [Candidatus Parcubacteria bacterium]|nr:MAG: phosphoadenylyl-sulfate reductase [Candidatus Parcubacteria bacterium]